MRLSLDTKVMAYAEGLVIAPGDDAKHAAALRLLEATADVEMALARQALAELHGLLARRGGHTAAECSRRVRLWAERADLVDTGEAVFEAALDLAAERELRIFDALILATAVEARCDLLLSEDLQDGFSWRGVVVSNPFGPAPDTRLKRLLARR